MLEELGEPYELVRYTRNAQTRLAPPELMKAHPLGKSPVMKDGSVKIAESGAILEYLAHTYAGGALARRPGDPEWPGYVEWLHYAEGSAMLPLMLQLYAQRLGDAGAPLHPRIDSQATLHLRHLETSLTDSEFLLRSGFSAADVQAGFVAEVARIFGRLAAFPALTRYLDALQARPACCGRRREREKPRWRDDAAWIGQGGARRAADQNGSQVKTWDEMSSG